MIVNEPGPATGASGWRLPLLAVALFAGLAWVFRAFTVDDAFIAYRHAANLAHGLGPVMNPGERVEGVSNLPWTLLLGLVAWLGASPDRAGPWASLLCGAGCVLLAARLASRLGGARAGWAAAFACAAGVPLGVWSASGMETSAAALGLVAALAAGSRLEAGERFALRFGAALGLVAALRPEGAMFLLPALAWAATRQGARGRRTLGIVAGFVLVMAPLVVFRRVYYEAWVPNPVHAKLPAGLAGLAPGALYTAKLLGSFPLLFVACVVSTGRALRTDGAVALARALVLTQLAFMLVVGGDHFAGYRFGAVVWPLGSVLVGLAALRWENLPGRAHPRVAAVATLALLAAGTACLAWPDLWVPLAEQAARLQRLQLPPEAHRVRLGGEVRHLGAVLVALAVWLWFRQAGRRRQSGLALAVWLVCTLAPTALDPQVQSCRQADAASRYGRVVGEWLGQNYPPATLVATNAAGSLPYFSGLPVVDMLGLADPHIARARPDTRQWIGHERGDAAYVLARRPQIVILGGPEGSATPWPFPGDQELVSHPVFQRDYVLRRVPLTGFEFVYYERQASGAEPPRGL